MALRRQVKNVVKNFTDIEVKVREATSNDPWGPSSSLTSEIADATYNVHAFTEIMTLLWKRINDHGKNWRHVYKSLVVLEYIVKTGSERVAQQCKENIFAVKTLKDFQFIDKDGKDQGVNVREKSKMLVALLKDEERLKSERQRALKAKERFSQNQGGIGNTSFPKNRKFQDTTKYPESRESVDDSNIPSTTLQEQPERPPDSRSTDGRIDSDIEKVRPSNEAEEEMQLQIALAMSREEAEHDERTQDVDNQLFGNASNAPPPRPQQPSTLLNLTDTTLPPPQSNNVDPWLQPPQSQAPTADPWGTSTMPMQQVSAPLNQPMNGLTSMNQPNPWGAPEPALITQPTSDPWGTLAAPAPILSLDPWGIPPTQPTVDPFAPQNPPAPQHYPAPQEDFPAASMSSINYNTTPLQPQIDMLGGDSLFGGTSNDQSSLKSGPAFLANGSHLVDVDNIMAKPSNTSAAANPFMISTVTNPFNQDKPKPKSINELRSDKTNVFVQPDGSGGLLPTPMQPSQNNPFL